MPRRTTSRRNAYVNGLLAARTKGYAARGRDEPENANPYSRREYRAEWRSAWRAADALAGSEPENNQ